MYALLHGHIQLSRNGVVFAEEGPGGLVGEMALIESSPRTATAIAKSAITVVPVDRQQFVSLVDKHPTFAIEVMKVMANRLRIEEGSSAE